MPPSNQFKTDRINIKRRSTSLENDSAVADQLSDVLSKNAGNGYIERIPSLIVRIKTPKAFLLQKHKADIASQAKPSNGNVGALSKSMTG
jgi:hypothetical protein